MQTQLNPHFDDVLEPFGDQAAEFFLAASLYHARKVSFGAAAALAGLSFEAFHHRLREHFDIGYILADETIREDMETANQLTSQL